MSEFELEDFERFHQWGLEDNILNELKRRTRKGARAFLRAEGISSEFELQLTTKFFGSMKTENISSDDPLYRLILCLRDSHTSAEEEWILAGNPIGFHGNERFRWYIYTCDFNRTWGRNFTCSNKYDFTVEPFPFGKQVSYEALMLEIAEQKAPLELLPLWLKNRL